MIKVNPGWVADDLINLQRVYRVLGDYRQALNCVSEALDIGRKLNDKRILQAGYGALGLIYESQADYASAIKWFTESLNLSVEAGNKSDISIGLYNIGLAQLGQMRFDDALRTFQEALKIAEMAGVRGITLLINEGLGNVYRAKREFAMALSCLEEASRLAEQLGDKYRLAETYWLKGETYYSIGDYLRASKLADQSFELAEQIGRPRSILWSLTLRGKVSLAQGKFDVARLALQQAIDTVEGLLDNVAADEVGRAQFIEGTRIAPYHLMIELLLREHKDREALVRAERTKARMLLGVLRDGRQDLASMMTSDEKQIDRELSARLTSLNRQLYVERQRSGSKEQRLLELNSRLDRARLEYETFRNELFAAHREPRSQRPETWHLDLDQLARLVSDHQIAFVEFVVTEERTHVFVITKAKDEPDKATKAAVDRYTVPVTKNELRELVSTFAERLGNPHIGEHSVSRRLYGLLLGPAKSLLRGKSTIVIVPDNFLWDLPFQALIQPDGKYLIQDHSVSYVPSLSVLGEMIKKTKHLSAVSVDAPPGAKAPALFALGNPSLSVQTVDRVIPSRRNEILRPLPETEAEVRTVSNFYRDGGSKVYTGADAREDRAKAEMSRYQILHFATHGILDSNGPMYSHIVLSTDEKSSDDGLLEVWEIMRLDLNADLAVLSACETARGRTGVGEGVIGLSWAFFVAGCPTTVVSQWKVHSASTAQLMIQFHRNLVSTPHGQQSTWKKANSLRQAMLALMKNPKYKDPYYWAAFVVVGDGR
jgi:CHAT domain-containing protein/tetratricopeptide (TPR) repeat protein